MNIRNIVLAFVFVFFIQNVSAQCDTLYTLSGDVLVGELKSLRLGVLTFDTQYADSDFKIEWSEVDGIIVNSTLLIYTNDGSRYIGTMHLLQGQPRLTRVKTNTTNITMTMENIVEITAIKKNLIDRMNIWLDAGYSYSKANNNQQLSVDGRFKYQAAKWTLEGDFSKVGTYQDQVDETSRTNGGGSFSHYIFGKTFAFAGLEFLRNSEQLLKLRTTSKVGLGYYFFRTNYWYMGTGIGLANSLEDYGGDNPVFESSFEGLGILELNAYDIGDLNVISKVSVYPSFTNKGRIRINSDFTVKYDLPLDFYIKISLTHNYDSEPLIDVPTTDFIFRTGVGWEWD